MQSEKNIIPIQAEMEQADLEKRKKRIKAYAKAIKQFNKKAERKNGGIKE